ncbi:ABC transporter permease [Nakamurella sp. YIM 132087]|uniref:ABC transporter permease n=1 Tax=Nakamurella alba TaxID=2665158 RepID=A0A7K1FQ09_9ACTN|nr:ABC transporter permease [Nakamurella alba]MTD16235.1 ABC transporter permease [Nakamurella alba]
MSIDPEVRPEGAHEAAGRSPHGWRAAVGTGLVVAIGLSALLALFVSLAVNAKPHGLVVDVVGPDAAVQQIRAGISAGLGEEAIELVAVPDQQQAIADLQDRTAAGALVITAQGPQVLIASAGSPVIAQLLTSAATELSGSAAAVQVTDVVPLPADDARGAGLGSAAFPMIVAGLALGAVAGLRFRRTGDRLVALATGAVAAGLLFSLVLHWLGVIDGRYLASAGAFALAAVAAGTFVAGTVSLLGVAGMGVAALVLMILGNPLSGIASSPALLPSPWGAIGQYLPPGAAGTLLRDAAYFPDASVWGPVLVLLGWMVLGAIGLTVAARRSDRRVSAAVPAAV